jgi:hypothetical protein
VQYPAQELILAAYDRIAAADAYGSPLHVAHLASAGEEAGTPASS